MNIKENTHAQNLETNALTKNLIDSGKGSFDTKIAQSAHALVNQVALYRGVSQTVARKAVAELLGD